MKLVVGLGNPGPRYETTRHNAGFLAIDRLADRWRARGPFERGQAEVWEAEFQGEKTLLLKPQTFMNLSGRAVAPVYRFLKCAPTDLVVIHDEVDLKPMQLRLKTGGGTGGHNGLKSLDESLGAGATGYHRIRIGVGKPDRSQPGPEVSDHVLGHFTDDELKALDGVLDQVADAVELILRGRMGDAMNVYNRN